MKTDIEIEELRPMVKFVFLTDLKGFDFEKYFISLLADFFEQHSHFPEYPEANKSQINSLREGYHRHRFNGEEDGVGSVWIKGVYIPHVKVYFFNGVDLSELVSILPEENFCGVIFRNHSAPENFFRQVMLISNAFDEFLVSKEIPFERYNFNYKTGYFLVKRLTLPPALPQTPPQ